MRTAILTFSFLLFLSGSLDLQADGRIEINQASVEAAGGFPFTISAPGNYVLTGPLTVPADTDGFLLTTSEVVIDLNGFSISSRASCNTTSCPSGTGTAIRPQSGIAHAHRCTMRNGIVRGFAGDCVQLGTHARVESLMVTECGLNGISVNSNSVVRGNRVDQAGENGISMSPSALFADNAINRAGLGGGGDRAVRGGKPSAGNSCDDGSCTSDGRRRFYLTKTPHLGSTALSACAAGFHMAAIDEIFITTVLQYDTTRGETEDDSGSGPPRDFNGWVRTGTVDNVSQINGRGNCNSWMSDNDLEWGTIVYLPTNMDIPAQMTSPWTAIVKECSDVIRVWCVED